MRRRTRRRPRPLDLRLLVPLTAAASLSSCALTGGRQTGDYAVEYFDWGVERATGTTSAELTNIVQQLPPSEWEGGTLVYLTGLDMLDDLDAIPRATHPGTQFGLLLAPVPVLDIIGSEDAISADSSQGRALLSLCRDVSADPWRLAPWFARLREDA